MKQIQYISTILQLPASFVVIAVVFVVSVIVVVLVVTFCHILCTICYLLLFYSQSHTGLAFFISMMWMTTVNHQTICTATHNKISHRNVIYFLCLFHSNILFLCRKPPRAHFHIQMHIDNIQFEHKWFAYVCDCRYVTCVERYTSISVVIFFFMWKIKLMFFHWYSMFCSCSIFMHRMVFVSLFLIHKTDIVENFIYFFTFSNKSNIRVYCANAFFILFFFYIGWWCGAGAVDADSSTTIAIVISSTSKKSEFEIRC